MRENENTKIIGRNVVLVPYKEKHVERYHEWMKSKELRYFTGSEILTLEEEFEMQKRWHRDQDKCTFIVLEKSVLDQTGDEIEAMIGDTNLFFNEPDQPSSAEVEIMIANVASRGKKRGWEATRLMLLYGIDKLNVTKYVAKIKFDNERCIKMFEKLQFREVKRSEVFEEYTFEKAVDEAWRAWLNSDTAAAFSYDIYSKQKWNGHLNLDNQSAVSFYDIN